MPSMGFGISILTHIAIIVVTKTKNFLRFAIFGRAKPKKADKKPNKVITALVIAAITELVLLGVVVSATAILIAGVSSPRSNYKILQGALNEFKNNSVQLQCLFNERCGYDHPDVNIPIS